MAVTKNTIIKDIRRYIAVLQENGIPVEKVILFGSWAKKNQSEESDIDVAVVSMAFSGDRFQDRRRIVPFRRKINTRIESMPFNSRSFDDGGMLVDEIIRYGLRII
ncbi:MAG: nucleotidyltransferase domain-containing protein [Desulfatirhabdiaceae bacterium]